MDIITRKDFNKEDDKEAMIEKYHKDLDEIRDKVRLEIANNVHNLKRYESLKIDKLEKDIANVKNGNTTLARREIEQTPPDESIQAVCHGTPEKRILHRSKNIFGDIEKLVADAIEAGVEKRKAEEERDEAEEKAEEEKRKRKREEKEKELAEECGKRIREHYVESKNEYEKSNEKRKVMKFIKKHFDTPARWINKDLQDAVNYTPKIMHPTRISCIKRRVRRWETRS